jgi:hypothetical protein
VNELDLLASLRTEVPSTGSAPVERAVMTAIRSRDDSKAAGSRHARPAGRRRRPLMPGRTGRPWLRPALAGGLALAIGAGAYGAVDLSGRPGAAPASQTAAWSGQPTAPWPAGPSDGRANSAIQLADFASRLAASPASAPSRGQWVLVETEYAQSSGGTGGYLFGPPDEREISLTWYRFGECGMASVPPVPASTPPSSTVTSKFTVSDSFGALGCNGDGGTLGGWKSVSYSYLSSLPTDPAALESVILAANPPSAGFPTREAAIFNAIYTLFSAGPAAGIVIPPKLQAALYHVLQQLPGVKFESEADLAGRTGLGFWMTTEGYLKEELVIDPDTYAYMGYEDVAIANHTMTGTDGTRYVKKGHVMGWGAVLGTAIVHKHGQLP